IGNFPVAVEPKFLTDGRLEIRNSTSSSVHLAVLFENRGGKSGYRVIHDLGSGLIVDRPQLTDNIESLHRELAAGLIEAGLYPKEAAAMIETWRDTWFEEGMRIFYLVPQTTVDLDLPLKIKPA